MNLSLRAVVSMVIGVIVVMVLAIMLQGQTSGAESFLGDLLP